MFRLLGSHSAMEHHASIYFCNERKMSAGCDRICGPHRVWGGIFVRPGPQQAHGKQGINYATIYKIHLCARIFCFPILVMKYSQENSSWIYTAEARFTLVLLASIVKTGSIKHKR